MRKKKNNLTNKQERFCREYIIDFNGARAAVASGYSKATAKAIAHENLTKPYIQERLAMLTVKTAKKLDISAESVLRDLNTVKDRCMQASPVTKKDSKGEIVEVGQYTFEHSGANRSLELLGKYLGLFNDRLKIDIGDVEAKILNVFNIIKFYVKDKKTLQKIAKEIEEIKDE